MYFIKILCDGDLFSSIQIIILFRYRNKVKITLNIILFYVKRCDKISTLIKNNYFFLILIWKSILFISLFGFKNYELFIKM